MAITRTNTSLRDRAVLLLINGASAEATEALVLQLGADPGDAKQIVAEARKRITVAADYTRDEQIGRAVMRLDDLYAKSIAAQDTKTALQAQRELNRLLDLYADSNRHRDGAGAGDDVAEMRRQLELIAAYLLPLDLAEAQYPIEEHVRLAAEILRRNGWKA